MEKKSEGKLEECKGNITLENRKKMTLTGVEEVISFDDEKILLNTKLGALTIKGQNLKMNKLDVQNGDVMINGEIYYIVYSGKEIKKEKEGIFARLFKLGALTIKGQNLKMNKLDVQNGDVMINGEIYYIVYSGKEIKKEKEGIFARLFK